MCARNAATSSLIFLLPLQCMYYDFLPANPEDPLVIAAILAGQRVKGTYSISAMVNMACQNVSFPDISYVS